MGYLNELLSFLFVYKTYSLFTMGEKEIKEIYIHILRTIQKFLSMHLILRATYM